MIHYGLYGQQHCISHDDLCGLNKETGGDYIARAENSGCEGFYTEVAALVPPAGPLGEILFHEVPGW